MVSPRSRRPYRPDSRAEIDAIEARRRQLRVSVADLAGRAGMSERKLMRIRRSGRAFGRDLVALRMALREIDKQRRAQARMFRAEGEADAD